MRVYGRLPPDEYGNRPWRVVETEPNGSNDYVYLTALVQTLKLNTGESPFFGNFGLPARLSVQTQIPPDAAVAFTQRYYSPFFASMIIAKVPTIQPATPTYRVNILRNNGSVFSAEVPL